MIKLLLRSWPLQCLAITLIYILSGNISLLLIIPPSYASPIWFPVGMSVASLLVFGISRWPAVFVGAIFISIQNHRGDPSYVPLTLIGITTTMGIVAGAYLIRRLLPYPKSFYFDRDILIFLLLAGPVTALFTSISGVLVLVLFGLVYSKLIILNWLHWFIGDASGGILVAPLALIFTVKSFRHWKGSITKVLIPLGVCLVLITGALYYVTKTEDEQIISNFNRQAELSYEILEKNLKSHQDLLKTLQVFYNNSTDITAEEFKNFSAHLHKGTNDIEALMWLPLSSERSYSFKIKYVEPLENNGQRLNTDLALNSDYKELILKAIRSQDVSISAPLKSEQGKGLVLAMAINVDQPRGVLIENLKPEALVQSLTNFIQDPSYHFVVTDITLSHKPKIVVDAWSASTKPGRFVPQLTWAREIQMGDRIWKISIEQDPGLRINAIYHTMLILLTSLTFVFLLCALLLTTANRVITTQALVDQKTEHLQELNLQLARASRTKSEFLANMSHEIRTPLNIIIGMADLLEDAPLESHQRQYLEISRKAGDNLLNIINDILDISKIESGLLNLEKTALDLPELLKEVYEMFRQRTDSKGLQFSLFIDDDVKNIYLGDPTRTRQILSNLVSNAIKFTNEGSIEIDVKPFSDPKVPGNILFEIRDTGIGVSPKAIPSLFQPFTQADSTITRKFGGTGLGLSICKRLTEMMNGSISAESEVGKGSTFRFTLTLPYVCPSSQITASAATSSELASKNNLRILVVDDTDDNRTLIRAYLVGTTHHISEADNGHRALELIQEQSFDVILMDMQMPGMNGFSTVRKIREYEHENNLKRSQIWALTSYALKTDIQRSLTAGCDRHLTKPLRKQELLRQIASIRQ